MLAPLQCQAGYVCVSGAFQADPTDNVTGYICPAGAYCPTGSAAPSWCSPGYFANSTANTRIGDCFPCTPGFECPSAGTVTPTVPCSPGYYCPGGIATPSISEACPLGHSCPTGSYQPVPCLAGSYANLTTQAACTPCPASYYCVSTTIQPAACPVGYYCPELTEFSTQFPCPAGTFGNLTLRGALEECTQCLAGMWCGAT
jgi:hypothetical protein